MIIVKIRLGSVAEVSDFENSIHKLPYDADLACGRYVTDARSVMGIFSMDLTKELELRLHTDGRLPEILRPYLA